MQGHVQFWRDEALAHLEIRLADHQRHTFPSHTHDTYAIGVMEHGACWCRKPGDDKTLVAPRGVACINPGQVHSGIPVGDEAPTYRMFYLDAAWVRHAAEELCEAPCAAPEFTRMVVDAPASLRAFLHLARLYARCGDRLAKETVLHTALGGLLENHADLRPARHTGSEPRAVRLAKDFLTAHAAEKSSLDDLARISGLSKYHLLRVFKRSVGLPPHGFHMQRRVELARTLMRQGMPLVLVAAEAGFVDQSHFSRTFKQIMGVPPSRYQTACPPLPFPAKRDYCAQAAHTHSCRT